MSRDEAMRKIVQSIALEQNALSRLIEAESAKLDRMLEFSVSLETLKKFNGTATGVMKSIADITDSLTHKFKLAFDCDAPC